MDVPAVPLGRTLAVTAALAVPSVGLVEKYLGYTGTALYIACVALAVALILVFRDALSSVVRERTAILLIVATIAALTGIVLWLHPMYDATKGDANEALNLAARQLFHGHYPYYPRTQLGNVISPLPGAVFFAMPFVALSDSAYQNVFWLALFAGACRVLLGTWRSSLLAVWAILALSPVVLQSLILGGDRVGNTLYVLLIALLLIRLLETGNVLQPWTLLTAALFGVALSSRANFVFVLPLVTATVARRRGWRDALTATGIVVLGFAAVTLPFYAYDPGGFTPTHQATKLHAAFPFARPLTLIAAMVLTLALAQRAGGRIRDFFACNALIQGALFAWTVFLFALDTESVQYTFTFMKEGYGVHFLFFGVIAALIAAGGADVGRTQETEAPDVRPCWREPRASDGWRS